MYIKISLIVPIRLLQLDKTDIVSLISEMRTKRIRSYENVMKYVIEKGLSSDKEIIFYKRLQDDYGDEFTQLVTIWLDRNFRLLIDKNPMGLISILESRAGKGPNYITIVQNLEEIDTGKLTKMYNLLKNFQTNESKIISGFFLGEICISPNLLLAEIAKNPRIAGEGERFSFLTAIRVASNRFRNKNFVLHDDVTKFVIDCTHSHNKKLLSEAIFLCFLLFEYDIRFKDIIKKYFSKSLDHRIYSYKCLEICDLSDQKFELSMLADAASSNSLDEIKTAMWVLGSKIFRSQHPTNRYLDKNKLQLFTLEFIHKLFTRINIDKQQLISESLLTEVGNINIQNALSYLTSWITSEPVDPVKHQSVYSKMVVYIFEQHEDELISFLSTLSIDIKNFDILIAYTVKEIVFDINLRLDSYFTIHNTTIVRDLKQLINDSVLEAEIDSLYAVHLDNLDTKLSKAIEIIDSYLIDHRNSTFVGLQSKKKDLQNKIDYVRHKKFLLDKCEVLLIDMCDKRQINIEKLTKNYRGKQIRNVMKRCEILRGEILNINREVIKYDDIRNKLSTFPNIEEYLGHPWLEKKCKEGYPYHHVILWLSKIGEIDEVENLIQAWTNESNKFGKQMKLQGLQRIMGARAWLEHLEKCLGYFRKSSEQGKKIIIDGLKDESNFFQFLTQLEIGLKLRLHGYKVDLEVKCDGKRIDIIACKNSVEKIFELATLDLYGELKYSGFAGDIPDRARLIMLEKVIGQISVYAKSHTGQIFILLNLTRAHDVDLHGVTYALHGSNSNNLIFDEGKVVSQFTTFKTDPDFLNLKEGKKLSGLIHCYNEFDGKDIKLDGKVIINDSAEIKLDENDIAEIKQIFFE